MRKENRKILNPLLLFLTLREKKKTGGRAPK